MTETNFLRKDGTWQVPAGTGGGTVNEIDTGRGLTGGPITNIGTVACTTDVPLITEDTQWNGKQVNGGSPVTLTDAAPTAWDMSAGNTFVWTLSASHKLSNPTNSKSGGTYVLYINQAGFTATFDTNIKVIGTLPSTGEAICGVYQKGSNTTILVGGLTGF